MTIYLLLGSTTATIINLLCGTANNGTTSALVLFAAIHLIATLVVK